MSMNKKILVIFTVMILLFSISNLVFAQDSGSEQDKAANPTVNPDDGTISGDGKLPDGIIIAGCKDASPACTYKDGILTVPPTADVKDIPVGTKVKIGDSTYEGASSCDKGGCALGPTGAVTVGGNRVPVSDAAKVKVEGTTIKGLCSGKTGADCGCATCSIGEPPLVVEGKNGMACFNYDTKTKKAVSCGGKMTVPEGYTGTIISAPDPSLTTITDDFNTGGVIELPGGEWVKGEVEFADGKIFIGADSNIQSFKDKSLITFEVKERTEYRYAKCTDKNENCIGIEGKNLYLTGSGIELTYFYKETPPFESINVLTPSDQKSPIKVTDSKISFPKTIMEFGPDGVKLVQGQIPAFKVTLNGKDYFEWDGTKLSCSRCSEPKTESQTASTATSFFSFVGKAWGWVTGRQTAEPQPISAICNKQGDIRDGETNQIVGKGFDKEKVSCTDPKCQEKSKCLSPECSKSVKFQTLRVGGEHQPPIYVTAVDYNNDGIIDFYLAGDMVPKSEVIELKAQYYEYNYLKGIEEKDKIQKKRFEQLGDLEAIKTYEKQKRYEDLFQSKRRYDGLVYKNSGFDKIQANINELTQELEGIQNDPTKKKRAEDINKDLRKLKSDEKSFTLNDQEKAELNNLQNQWGESADKNKRGAALNELKDLTKANDNGKLSTTNLEYFTGDYNAPKGIEPEKKVVNKCPTSSRYSGCDNGHTTCVQAARKTCADSITYLSGDAREKAIALCSGPYENDCERKHCTLKLECVFN